MNLWRKMTRFQRNCLVVLAVATLCLIVFNLYMLSSRAAIANPEYISLEELKIWMVENGVEHMVVTQVTANGTQAVLNGMYLIDLPGLYQTEAIPAWIGMQVSASEERPPRGENIDPGWGWIRESGLWWGNCTPPIGYRVWLTPEISHQK